MLEVEVQDKEVPKEYRESIKWLAKNRSNKVIFNTNEAHAVVILSEMLKNAEDYVHILCENMNPKVTDEDEYVDAMRKFLNNDKHKIKVLLTDYDKNDKKFDDRKIVKLFKNHKEQVEMKYFEPKAKVISGDTPINWTVSDNRAFRFEKDIEKCIASVNFNNPPLAKKLNESFNAFFNDDDSKKYQL